MGFPLQVERQAAGLAGASAQCFERLGADLAGGWTWGSSPCVVYLGNIKCEPNMQTQRHMNHDISPKLPFGMHVLKRYPEPMAHGPEACEPSHPCGTMAHGPEACEPSHPCRSR